MGIARLISGIVIVVFGSILNLIGLIFFPEFFVALIYGIPIFVIGLIILLNKNEDKIEEIKKK